MDPNHADPAASASYSSEPDFKLGDWWVRPQRNELDRTGETAHVEARSMGVLVCLARHAPRVVSRQRLLEEVWSDSPYVGDEAISHAIWELRKVLGDSAREPVYIQTVPRKGYVLLAEVVRPRGSPLPIAGARIDHYDILEELGRGSMGVVFKAFDRRLERTVAIKFLAPELTRDHEACRRFQREAQLAAALDHPNLATVHAIGETSEGQHYLVTPFYAGGSLKAICAKGDLTLDGAVRFATQLACGLAAAHAQGIVHRDIKPANLLIDEHGTLKIADFGIAKLLGATDLTRTGVSLGTPAYKSPEQARGHEVDHRSDIWSMGVVFFEMLTGRRPFGGEFEQAVIHSILTADPAAETDAQGEPIPEGLRRIVARAMAREPGERYQRAEEVVGDLEGLDGAVGTAPAVPKYKRRLAGRASPRSPPRRSRARGRARIATVAAVCLLLLAVAGYLASPWTAARPNREIRVAISTVSDLWLRGNDRDNLAEVRRQLSVLAERAPDRPEVLGLYAVFLADAYALGKSADDRSEAYRLVAKSQALDPDSALARVATARLLLLEPDPEGARSLAQEAVDLEAECEPRDNCDLAYVWLGEALWALGQQDAALAALGAGIRQGNGHIRCRLKRAQLYEDSGRFELAILDYREVLRADPDQTTALNDLGLLYLKRRLHEEAVPLFERSFQRTGDPRALLNLGNGHYEFGALEEAIDSYQRALELYPKWQLPTALPAVALGDAYVETSEVAEATRYYLLALESFDQILAGPDPGLADRGRRAVCLAKLGRIGEAEQEIESLLPHHDRFSALLIYAARIAALSGDREALLAAAKRALDAGLSPVDLRNDVAFIRFREDPEYLALLSRGSAAVD